MSSTPRVFISYSHDSDQHRAFVLALANRLRTEDVDARIDQYVLGFPPEGWQRWMESNIEQADFVLLVCTPLYLQRYNGNDHLGGRGVNFEGVVITQSLYEAWFRNDKFIPVIPDSGSLEDVPRMLRQYSTYRVFQQYDDLYRLLTKQPEVIMPPLGQRVPMPAKPLAAPSTSIRSDETAYLEDLLQQRLVLFTDQTYTTLAGAFQQDRQLMPDECMPASFMYEAYERGQQEPRECRSEPEQHSDLLAAFARYRRLALLGEPGTGKTFSLWRIAAQQARDTLNGTSLLLPVVIPLNRWTDDRQSLTDFVLEQMGSLAGRYDELCKAGRLLPLLDALNEIPFDQRKAKLTQVKAFVNQSDFRHLLLTCRQRDYSGKLEQDMDRLTVEPLDPPRIRQFLRNYFAYFNQRQPGCFEPDVADKLFWQLAGNERLSEVLAVWEQAGASFDLFWTASEIPQEVYTQTTWDWKHSDLWKTCRHDSRSLMKLAENPYLLSLITALYSRERELPRSRVDLFERFTNDLLLREEKAKAQSREFIPERTLMQQQLKQLAWRLQRHTGLQEEVRTTLLRKDARQLMPEPWLEFAAAASLLELTRDSVRFSHQLLQEFFTAQCFREERDKGLQACDLWPADRWWEASGWEEAAKLAVEYTDNPEAFLQWLAAGQPKLAYEVAKGNGLLTDELFAGFRSAWQHSITDIENHPNPHERHAISTVLAWLDWDDRPHIGLDANGLPDIGWVDIPAGEFIFSEEGELGRQILYLPAYKMSRHPVTNAQFQAFVTAGGYETDQWWEGLEKPDTLPNHQWTEGSRPVERVDWYESIAFCRWLSAKTGLEIRLPTEQEWEKAARGADGRDYPWGGKEYKMGFANIDETYGDAGAYNWQETSAVGIYPQGKSPYGLLDASGNVWEWCLNRYDEPETITPDLSDRGRVVRGGSWSLNSEYCRLPFRSLGPPLRRNHSQGFRLLLASPLTTDLLTTASLKAPPRGRGWGGLARAAVKIFTT